MTSRIRSRSPDWTADWLKDSGLLVAFQFFATLSTSALAIILARSLGPSDWGLFSGLLALTLAVATFVEFGLATWLLREMSAAGAGSAADDVRREAASRRIAGALAATGTIGATLLAASVAVLALTGTSADTAVAFVCLLGYTIALAAATCIEAYFRATRKVGVAGGAIGVEKVVLVAGAGGLALLGLGIPAIALGYLGAGVIRLAYVATVAFRRDRLAVRRPRPEDVWSYFRSGLPFAFNTMALTVIPRVDTFLIALISTTAAGFFAIGDRVLGPAIIIPVVAGRALYPFFAREGHGSRTPWQIAGAFFCAGALIAGAGVLLAPPLVPAVFGDDYGNAVGVVQVMLVALPFVFASNALLVRLYSAGGERSMIGVTLVASLAGTGAVVLGQIAIGAAGAAGGYVLRQILFTAGLALRTGRATSHVDEVPGGERAATRVP